MMPSSIRDRKSGSLSRGNRKHKRHHRRKRQDSSQGESSHIQERPAIEVEEWPASDLKVPGDAEEGLTFKAGGRFDRDIEMPELIAKENVSSDALLPLAAGSKPIKDAHSSLIAIEEDAPLEEPFPYHQEKSDDTAHGRGLLRRQEEVN